MARKKTYRPTDAEKKALSEVESAISEAMRWHRDFARRVERRYEAYRGMLPENAPKTWRSNVHQPLLINIVEGMLASMEEAQPSWRVTPQAIPGMTLDDLAEATEGAEVCEVLVEHQMRIDDFAAKQGPYMQQDLIAGFTPGKIFWLRKARPHRFLDEQPEMIFDEAGGTLDIANVLDEYERDILERDDPTFEPRDVRDFLYPESATSIETAPWIIDRTFVHYRTLERMEQLGIYRNVEFAKETRVDKETAQDQTTRSSPDIVQDRERRLRSADRTRGLVEIVEKWTDERVVTVANRTIVLRDVPNPHWHGQKPFVTCSAIPDAFQIPGISVIEGLAQMQEMVWTLQNMRLDSTRLMANLIKVVKATVEDDDFEWAPEATWRVNSLDDVKLLDIDPKIAGITLQAESLLKGDIQNTMGGLPYTGGAESQTIDQTTATGISIVTNIAQSILMRRKRQYLRTFGRIGKMFVALDQQFLRQDRVVPVYGPSGAEKILHYVQVQPAAFRKHLYDVNVEMVGDSMMRQERRAESGALLTQAVQFAGPSAQMGVKLNLRRFWEKHLDAYDVPDKMSYFLEEPQQGQAAPGAGTPQGQESLLEDMAGDLEPGGITNESLAAGPTSPSTPVSMSPAAAMQQSLARVGAGRSV